MFEVRRPKKKQIVVIRTATPQELSDYEKWKIKNIEEGAQVNKIEAVRIMTSSNKEVFSSIDDKIATIEVGELALKNRITSEDISPEELFLIECALDDSIDDN
jgi:hypothetical protein